MFSRFRVVAIVLLLVFYSGCSGSGGSGETSANSTNVVTKIVNAQSDLISPAKIPLPDRSEGTTEMRDDGSFIEVRKFLKDPDLDKIERVLKTPKDVRIKVYLRNGKVYDLDESKVKNYRTDTPYTILQAIGVKQTVIDKSGGKTKEQLKAEQQIKPPAHGNN